MLESNIVSRSLGVLWQNYYIASNPMIESSWTSSTRPQLYDRHNGVSANNKYYFDRNQITDNVGVLLIRQNINAVSKTNFQYLFLNNYGIVDIAEIKTIVGTSAIVEIIIDYDNRFYSQYKLWMYFSQQGTSPK